MNDPRSHSKYRRIRAQVVGRPGSKPCFWCGRPATEADHLVPVSKGGEAKDRRNMVPACRHCNASRGNRAEPRREQARSVFSTQRNHIPRYGREHTHRGGRTTLAADYTRRTADAGR